MANRLNSVFFLIAEIGVSTLVIMSFIVASWNINDYAVTEQEISRMTRSTNQDFQGSGSIQSIFSN